MRLPIPLRMGDRTENLMLKLAKTEVKPYIRIGKGGKMVRVKGHTRVEMEANAMEAISKAAKGLPLRRGDGEYRSTDGTTGVSYNALEQRFEAWVGDEPMAAFRTASAAVQHAARRKKWKRSG